MKKSIVYLGIALVSFSAVTQASNHNPTAPKQINHSIFKGATPLCIAIYKGEIDLVRKLIAYGINVNEKSNGLTPLMIAARYNKVEIIKLLLTNGAHLKEKNAIGVNALKYAEISNAKDAVVFLKLSESKPIASL